MSIKLNCSLSAMWILILSVHLQAVVYWPILFESSLTVSRLLLDIDHAI